MFEELKDGKFVLINGVIHTLTPLNSIEDIEDEAKKAVELKVRSEMASEQLIRELGRAGEFFLENGWKYHFVNGTAHFILAAPFEGGVMEHKDGAREFQLYIPNGYMALDMSFNEFPNMNSQFRIMPKISNESLKETFAKYSQTFRAVHPHCFAEGTLCSGMNSPHIFDINIVVQMLKDCIAGSAKKEGTSVWDYNPNSPATNIAQCTYGKMAFKLHSEGKSDDQIWEEIIKAKPTKKDMREYIETGEQ